ncbi:MAG TPA: gluconokinase [Abditibacteriaceae bacterium]
MNTESSSPRCIVALDIGTSSTRALVFDEHGHKVGDAAQRPYDQTTTVDGGVECDADELFELTAQCLDEVHPNLANVAAVATSCFWHSLMCVDSAGRALSPVYSWADNRSSPWLAPLRSMLDEHETHARTGCVFHTSYWPAKLLWLSQTRPQLFGEDTHWISFGEYVALKIFGTTKVSYSMASGTGLFHQNNCDWDDETLRALPLRKSHLSELCDHNQNLGALSGEWAERWPHLQSAKWFPAIGDGACSNIGSGGVDDSRIVLNVGTSAALRVVLENFEGNAPRGLWRYRVDKRRSLMGGAVSNAGNVFAWARDTFRLPDDAEAQISAMQPDVHGLTVLPFLAGERSPLWNADARLVIEGASLDTSPVTILRACLEAASLRFAEVARSVRAAMKTNNCDPDVEIVASGGALERSACWTQIVADCLGTPLVESRESEASARGAALLALEACGIIDDIRDLPAERGGEVQPNSEHHEVYVEALERQNALYDQLFATSLSARKRV